MRYVKLSHEVTHATYNEQTGKWHLRVRRANPETGVLEEIEDVTDILVTAFGALSRWQMPDIPGIKDYKGVLHHSAGFDPADKTWQEVVDGWKDKRVGIIGVVSIDLSMKRSLFPGNTCSRFIQGSSALQIVPALQPRVSRVVNFVRGKTWLALPFGSMTFSSMLGREPRTKEECEWCLSFRHVCAHVTSLQSISPPKRSSASRRTTSSTRSSVGRWKVMSTYVCGHAILMSER